MLRHIQRLRRPKPSRNPFGNPNCTTSMDEVIVLCPNCPRSEKARQTRLRAPQVSRVLARSPDENRGLGGLDSLKLKQAWRHRRLTPDRRAHTTPTRCESED
jgi:hypothetical protein